MQPIAVLVALALAGAPAAPPPPPPAAEEPAPSEVPTPVQPTTPPATDEPPPPTIAPTPTQPGAPKRVYMPGAGKKEVVLPTPVDPTPVKPTPVLPTGPQPVLPGTDPDENGNTTTQPVVGDEPRTRRTKRDRRPRNTAGSDNGSPTGRCFAPQERCRTFVITGIALAAVGAGIAGGGAALLAQPVTPLRDDPTQVKSFRPPGGAMVGLGAAALVAGIVVIAAGVVGHKRDQSLRRQAAWWRPRFSVGIVW